MLNLQVAKELKTGLRPQEEIEDLIRQVNTSHIRQASMQDEYEIDKRVSMIDFDRHLIGMGGFGTVIRVRRRRDGKPFAVKYMDIEGDEQRQMIERECALNKVLNCQYIVHLEEIIETSDKFFLIFELMDSDMSDLERIRANDSTEEQRNQWEDFCKFTLYSVAKGI